MVIGQIYVDADNNLYEVVDIHFHWYTRDKPLSKRVVEFISYKSGSFYVLDEETFLSERKLFLDITD